MGNIGRQTTHLFSTRLPWKKSVQNAASCSSSASRSLMCLPGIRWIRKAAVPAIVAVPIIAPIVIGLPSGPWICPRSRRSLRSRLRSRLRGCLRRRLSCDPWARRRWPLKGRGWRCSPASALPAWLAPAARAALAARAAPAAPAAVAAPVAVAAPAAVVAPAFFAAALLCCSAALLGISGLPHRVHAILLGSSLQQSQVEASRSALASSNADAVGRANSIQAADKLQGHHVAGAALLHCDSPFLKRNTIKTRPICCQKMKSIFH